jgi:hypothetical protein
MHPVISHSNPRFIPQLAEVAGGHIKVYLAVGLFAIRTVLGRLVIAKRKQ